MNNSKFACFVDQAVVIVTIMVCFMLAAVYRYVLQGKNIPGSVFFVLVPMVIILLAWGIKRVPDQKIITLDNEALLEVFLFALIVLLRIPLFHYMQRYDAGIYWGAIYKCAKNFEFSLPYIWNNFKIWGHPSIMFTFFSIIGEFFTLGNSIGYCMINTKMSVFAVICIYRTCTRKLGIDKIVAFLLCITLQCVPIFWGTFPHVNPDYMLLIFFVYMWYSHVFDKYILCFFWMFCLVQTKETGSVIVFGYALFHMLNLLVAEKGDFKAKLRVLIKNPYVIICIINAALLIVSFLIQGDVITWQLPDKESHSWLVGMDKIRSDGTDVNAFGIYPKYIACKIIHMFSLNYSWIATAIIVICILFSLKKHFVMSVDKEIFLPLIGALFFFALFNMLYITYALYRYNVFSVVAMWLIALLFLTRLIKKRSLIILCNALLMIILAIQTFTNADFLSDRVFNKYNTGNGYLIATDMKKIMYGDNIVNNYKYSYIDKLLDSMLESIDYSEDITIVYDDDDSINRIDVWAKDSLGGWNYFAGWNKEKLRREIIDDNNELCKIKTISYSEMKNGGQKDSDKYILYYFDFSQLNSDNVKKELADGYTVEFEKTLNNWGGNLHYILINRK